MKIILSAISFAAAQLVPLFAQQPEITSIVSSADFKAGITYNTLSTAFGVNFSSSEHVAAALPLPRKLGETEVLVCGDPIIWEQCDAAGLLYVGPRQINFVMPRDPGRRPIPIMRVAVRRASIPDIASTGGPSINPRLLLNAYEPRIFEVGYDCSYNPLWNDPSPCGVSLIHFSDKQPIRGAVTDQDGRLVTSANPARVGKYYTIWATGLNRVPTVNSMGETRLTLGGLPGGFSYVTGVPEFTGETTQFVGLYQVNFLLSRILRGPYPVEWPPCMDYRLEMTILIHMGSPARTSNSIQMPALILKDEIDCR